MDNYSEGWKALKEQEDKDMPEITNTQEEIMNAAPAKMTALVKLEKLSPEEVQWITALLEKNILPHLQSDVSNYAKGRQRVWLPYAAPLGNQPFTPELMDDEVWQWIVDRCAKHGFKAQLALISKGGNINPHADTTYAATWAMGFNLGKCDWHIQNDRNAKRTPAKPTQADLDAYYQSPTTSHLSLTGGEVFKFNCKHEHAVTNAAPDRWSINVWAIANGPAAYRANIARRLEQMLRKHPEVQEFIDLHQPGAQQNEPEAIENVPKITNTRKESAMNKPLYKVAFTGHRPTKIGGYNTTAPMRVAVTEAIKNALTRAVAKYGDTHEVVVISGGALGVDTDSAREAHKMGLRFMIAAPCRNQDKKWPADSKMTYRKMIGFANADLAEILVANGETVEQGVVYVHDGEYTGAKLLMDRNIWMVDHADAVVAIWDGSQGGTANCVGYARSQHKPMLIINPKDLA